jgi:four helix bundle protein
MMQKPRQLPKSAHFISFIEICEREARETQFALQVVMESHYIPPQRVTDLYQESCEIVAILTTIGKKAKQGKNKGRGGEAA